MEISKHETVFCQCNWIPLMHVLYRAIVCTTGRLYVNSWTARVRLRCDGTWNSAYHILLVSISGKKTQDIRTRYWKAIKKGFHTTSYNYSLNNKNISERNYLLLSSSLYVTRNPLNRLKIRDFILEYNNYSSSRTS